MPLRFPVADDFNTVAASAERRIRKMNRRAGCGSQRRCLSAHITGQAIGCGQRRAAPSIAFICQAQIVSSPATESRRRLHSKLRAEPLPSHFIDTPRHWQDRATEMRALAGTVDGRDAHDTMLRMAQHYDRLATRAEQRAREALPATPQTSEVAPPQSDSVFAWWLASENA